MNISRYKVKLEHQGGPDQAPDKEPSFAHFHRFSTSCPKCKCTNEFYYPIKGAYTEADLLKLAQASFHFAGQKDCGCHEQKEKSKTT